MNQRTTSALAFASSAAAAVLAALAMTGTAQAEGPIGESSKFVSERSRAEVQSETRAARTQLSSAGNEWLGQQNGPLPTSSLTRAQVRDEYIAAREEVMARNSEGGGSDRMAAAPARSTSVMAAAQPQR